MIPYILAAVGGYLIGDSLKGKQYAYGGKVNYVENDPYDQKYFRRFNDAIGSFGWKYNGNYNEGILYPLESFDKEYYSHIELKKDEVLLRYRTDRMVKEAKYLIKFNLDKALIYFMSDSDSDDDKNPKFETRGIKAEYIVILKDYAPKIMADGGVIDNYLSSRSEMFTPFDDALSKKDVIEFINISKNSDKKYWIRDSNGYSKFLYKGQLRANDSTSGIFEASKIGIDKLNDSLKYKIQQEELYDYEKEMIPYLDEYQNIKKSIPKENDWTKYVKENKSYFSVEEETENRIQLATRQNGNVGDEEPSSKDIKEAKEIYKKVKSKYPNTKGSIETVDEWVYLELENNMSDGGMMAKGGAVKRFVEMKGDKPVYALANAIYHFSSGTLNDKGFPVTTGTQKVYRTASGLKKIKEYKDNPEYSVLEEKTDDKGIWHITFVANKSFIMDGKETKDVVSFDRDDLYANGGMMAKGGTIEEQLEKINVYNDLDAFEYRQYKRMVDSGMSKADALKVIINDVEGDTSQLSKKLASIAKKIK